MIAHTAQTTAITRMSLLNSSKDNCNAQGARYQSIFVARRTLLRARNPIGLELVNERSARHSQQFRCPRLVAVAGSQRVEHPLPLGLFLRVVERRQLTNDTKYGRGCRTDGGRVVGGAAHLLQRKVMRADFRAVAQHEWPLHPFLEPADIARPAVTAQAAHRLVTHARR